jgi:fatty-acyl-CoA synthase
MTVEQEADAASVRGGDGGLPQDGRLYVDLLVASLHRWGDRLLFDQPAGERSYSYRESGEWVARMIAVLAANQVGRGAGVGVLSNNRAEAWMAAVAPQIAGGYYCALPTRASVDDLVYMITTGELRAVIVDPALAELGAEVTAQCPTVKVFTLGPSELGVDLLKAAEEVGTQRLQVADGVRDDEMCQLWFTGGTTGRPKAAVHTNRSWLDACWRYLIAYELPFPIRYAALGPLSHSGYPQVQPTVMTGGSVTVLRAFDPERFFHVAADRRLNLSVAVPTMLYALLEYAESSGVTLPDFRRFIYGGSPMSSDRLAQLQERMGSVFLALYGTSESIGSGTVLLSSEHDASRPERLISCGRVVPGVTLSLLDDELQPVDQGATGEVCVRSKSMMAGYFKEPAMTAEAFRGGWFHTGDLARVDDEGYYTLVDRKKDMIISGGFNVYPAEIENLLMSDPTIRQVAVFGIPDRRWGEAVHVAVVPAEGHSVDADAIVRLVREKKGPVYAPKSVEIVESLPTTPAGKVDKRALRAPYWVGQERAI